jgi:hypothetical protein
MGFVGPLAVPWRPAKPLQIWVVALPLSDRGGNGCRVEISICLVVALPLSDRGPVKLTKVASGITMVMPLPLSDRGAPGFSRVLQKLGGGVARFLCIAGGCPGTSPASVGVSELSRVSRGAPYKEAGDDEPKLSFAYT